MMRVLGLAIAAAILTTCTVWPGAAPPSSRIASWGRIPTPQFSADSGTIPSWTSAPVPGLSVDPVNVRWAGKLDLSITAAPVFRYDVPTFAQASRFASGLHATAESDTRPNGRSWSYGSNAEDFRVVVVPADDTRGSGAFYLIFPAPDTPVAPASAGPLARATEFLTRHGLMPGWPYRVATRSGETQSAAFFERQMEVPGYGHTDLVDGNGSPEGLSVSFDGDRMLEVAGLFPLSLQKRDYAILTADAAFQAAYGALRPAPPGAPTVALTQAVLDYVLVEAGDHGYYVPVYLYSGAFRVNGEDRLKQVLAPALDSSQKM